MHTNLLSSEDGFIRYHNMSGFVAYSSITYYIDGKKTYIEYPTFSLFFYETVPIPANATNITIALWNQVTILKWVIFWQATFPSPVQKCYTISGVLLVNPTVTETPCNEALLSNPHYNQGHHHSHYKCYCPCRRKCCPPRCYK